jgi:hypothetical protein
MLSGRQEELMASEWIKLTDDEINESVYVNLANARSIIRTMNGGSAIWFLGGIGKDGRVNVKETPEEVLALIDEVKSAKGP